MRIGPMRRWTGGRPSRYDKDVVRLDRYRWDAHCRGLYQTPIAA